MRWNKVRWWAGAAVVVLFCQCGSPSLDPGFLPLYVELRIATQEFGQLNEEARRVRLQILERHGYTAAQFDSTRQFLEEHPDLWRAFQKDLVIALEALEPPRVETPPPSKVPTTPPLP